MENCFLFYKTLNKFFLVLVVIYSIILIACSDFGTEFNGNNKDKWHGKLSVDFIHSILKPDGTVWGWGNNSSGTLGNGTDISSDYPVKVVNLVNIISIDQSYGAEVALDVSGNVWFWGNLFIYFGPPNIDTNVVTPIKLTQIENPKTISMDGIYIYVMTTTGRIYYIKMDFYSPNVVEGPTLIRNIARASYLNKSLCICDEGQIFNLHTTASLQDNNLNAICKISGAINRHIVVLKKDGTVWGWGHNDLGQLGNGTYEDSQKPIQTFKLFDIIEVSANYDYNLALRKDGTVWYWGYCGRIGDSLISQNIPVKIDSLPKAVSICSGFNGLIMTIDGSYWLFNVNKKLKTKIRFN
ncbi:MAG: hypothetical protein WA440_10060 [Ignavibacteriaceae bacterium]